jgi:hypothetical protein
LRVAAPLTPDLDTRKRLVSGMVRLSLWYVRLLLAQGKITARDLPRALSCRVNLYRLTVLWDGVRDPALGYADPEWTRLRGELARLILATPAEDTSELETQGLSLLWPALEGRLPQDVGPPRQRPFGCWSYELAWEGMGDGPGWLGKLSNPTHVAQKLRKTLGLPPGPSRGAVLHLENAYAPSSPFARSPELIRSLRGLLAECRRLHPSVRTLWADTWLNSHPAFLALFPDSWRRSGAPCPPGNNFNWWGQFVTRTGDFDAAAAARFRASGGQFHYPALLCHAPLASVDEHLAWKQESSPDSLQAG